MSEQCQAMVWIRDTYRRTGRGPSGFEMHYDHRQCSRQGVYNELCWQHRDQEVRGTIILRHRDRWGTTL